MSKRRRIPLRTSSGAIVPPGIERGAWAETQLLLSRRYGDVLDELMRKFDVAKSTAEEDIALARQRIAEAAEKDRPFLRERETERLARIADKAEKAGEYTAAVQASRALSRLNGLEVKIVSVGAVTPEQQAMVGALALSPHQRQQRIAKLRAELEHKHAELAEVSAGDRSD